MTWSNHDVAKVIGARRCRTSKCEHASRSLQANDICAEDLVRTKQLDRFLQIAARIC
jgi:hypothetical protein